MDEVHRGNGCAGKACWLLAPVMWAHGMELALINSSVDNAASRRVCEKMGARFLRAAALPEDQELYLFDMKAINVFKRRPWIVVLSIYSSNEKHLHFSRFVVYYEHQR